MTVQSTILSARAQRVAMQMAGVALCGALLAGCGGRMDDSRKPGSGFGRSFQTNADYRDVYPISVSRSSELIEISDSLPLTQADEFRISAFARSYRRARGSDLTIAHPEGVDVSKLVRRISRLIAAQGVRADEIASGAYSVEAEGSRGIVVSYYAQHATGPDCPAFWGDTMFTPANASGGRLGCWMQANVAAMVSQPEDLKRPRAKTPAITERKVLVMRNYAEGEATTSESTIDLTTTQ